LAGQDDGQTAPKGGLLSVLSVSRHVRRYKDKLSATCKYLENSELHYIESQMETTCPPSVRTLALGQDSFVVRSMLTGRI